MAKEYTESPKEGGGAYPEKQGGQGELQNLLRPHGRRLGIGLSWRSCRRPTCVSCTHLSSASMLPLQALR